jgi:hypothetical protein
MDACRRVDVLDPSLYPRHAHGRLGTIHWADRLAILTLDACHVQTPLQNGKAGAQSDSHIFAIDGIPLQPSDPVWR